MTKTIFIIVIVILFLFQCVLLYFGVSHLIGSLSFILVTVWIIYFIFKRILCLLKKEKYLANTRLFFGTVLVLWIITELFLRFAVCRYDSYSENKRLAFYISPYLAKETVSFSPWQKPLHVYHSNDSKVISCDEYEYDLITNSEGIRDKEIAEQKMNDEFRIIGLGDSFTEGRGAPSDSSWVKLLENRLQQVFADKKITTINAGISGSDPFFEYDLLQERLLKYEPDLVILALNMSDVEDVIVRGGTERFQDDGTIRYNDGPKWEWLYATSYIFRHIIHDVFGYDRLLLKPAERNIRQEQSIEKIFSCIKKFAQFGRLKKFELLVVFHPMLHEVLVKNFKYDKLIKKVRSETNINVLNLLDYYILEGKMSPETVLEYYWEKDQHHNSKGYELFAKGVYDSILSKRLIKQ